MYFSNTMNLSFEIEKRKKAFSYTAIICGAVILLAIFIQWPLTKPTPPLVEDLIEVNLGNEIEGDGEIQ
ncbi:MAG: hypothetical protein ACOYKE_12255, partial [Ferruginibacter sp.]